MLLDASKQYKDEASVTDTGGEHSSLFDRIRPSPARNSITLSGHVLDLSPGFDPDHLLDVDHHLTKR